MAVVVFFRGANLGSRRFSPKAVEKALADLESVNIGAAGTFVVRKPPARAKLLARFASTVPFDPLSIVCTDAQVRAALVAGERVTVPPGAKRFATVVEPVPRSPKLPLEEPAGTWGVRVVALKGPFAIGVRRPVGATGVYPNAVIEKAWSVRATTRDWPTMEKVGRVLAPGIDS